MTVELAYLPRDLKDRNMHEFNTQEELVRIFHEKFVGGILCAVACSTQGK